MTSPVLSRGLLRTAVATLLTAVLAGVAGPVTAPAQAAPRSPSVPPGLPAAIEPLASYVPANSCNPAAKPGTTALAELLVRTYPGTSYGISRSCGAGLPTSEHYDGRAVDWMNSVRTPAQAAQADAVISWLRATDSHGNAWANARRLGVMYVIWDDHILGLYDPGAGWRPYSSCAQHPERSWDTTCHRDHMHLSLTWPGAMGTTSFWTGRVAAPDYGPCRARDLNWAGLRTRVNPIPCPRYPVVRAPAGSSATVRTLFSYSGMRLRSGQTGPAVTAVQRALGVRATGTYASLTRAAVRRLQARHHLSTSGTMNTATWRALLAEQTR